MTRTLHASAMIVTMIVVALVPSAPAFEAHWCPTHATGARVVTIDGPAIADRLVQMDNKPMADLEVTLGGDGPGVDANCDGRNGGGGGGQPPLAPNARAEATIEATIDGEHVCTGTYETVATGTVGGKVGGGVIIKAEVTFSTTVSLLTSYNFACDYGMFVRAYGENGFLRRVHAAVWDSETHASKPIGADCEYTGLPGDSQCAAEPPALFLKDAFTGSGLAGPASGSTPLWPLPTFVTICPESDEELVPVDLFMSPQTSTAQAWNDAYQDLPYSGVFASDQWECTSFGIHYQ